MALVINLTTNLQISKLLYCTKDLNLLIRRCLKTQDILIFKAIHNISRHENQTEIKMIFLVCFLLLSRNILMIWQYFY